MAKPCFFCDIQKQNDKSILIESDNFFVHLSDFPCLPGHCEIAPKQHFPSFFDLPENLLIELYSLLHDTKNLLTEKFNPDAFTIGINDGEAAGQTQMHLHIHLIPRHHGDVPNTKGGIRNMFPINGDYTTKLKNIPGKEKYQ